VADILADLKRHLPGNADPGRNGRVARAKRDFFFFCRTYLPHLFTSDFSEFHTEVIEILESPDLLKIALAAPRNHGKTTLVYVGYALWALLSGKEDYVVVIAASSTMAQEQLFNVKQELEVNEMILADFGDQKTDVWRQDLIVLRSGACVTAKGAAVSMRGMVKRGKRPSLVIMDDLEKDVVANSAVMRSKLDKWIRRVVFPLGRDAKIFYIGTILHYDSVLKRFLDEFEGKPGWFVKRYRAIKEDGTPLWPEYWTIEKLEEKKREMGTAAFSTEYQNEPVSDEDRVFKPEWFEFYERNQVPARLDAVMAVDPSTGKVAGDYQGLVVLGKDRQTGIIYVLDAVGERVSDLQLAARIIAMWKRFRPRVILFEDLVFQAIYRQVVARQASAMGVTLPLRGIKPNASKEVRIRAVAPLIENGVLCFHRSQTLLLQQLEEFPGGGHDDLPDALAYAVAAYESRHVGATPIGHQPQTGIVNTLGRMAERFFGM